MTQEGKMGEWISVEERLPQLNQRVLAWRGRGPILLTYDAFAEEHHWWNDGRQVTHWMPLPSPPSAEKEER